MKYINAAVYEITSISQEGKEDSIKKYLTPSELNERVEYLELLKGQGNIKDYSVECIVVGFNASDLTIKDIQNMSIRDLKKIMKDDLY